MMKKYLPYIISTTIIIAAIFLTTYMNRSKLAYVDINKLVQNYNEYPQTQQQIEDVETSIKQQMDSIMDVWGDELRKYEKERNTLTKNQRALEEQLLKKKQVQLNKYSETLEKKKSDRKTEIMNQMFTRVNSMISEYGDQNGYQIILGANGNGSLVYVDKSFDITDDVLKYINSKQ